LRRPRGFVNIFSSALLDKFPGEAQNSVHFGVSASHFAQVEPSRLAATHPEIFAIDFWHSEISGGEHMVEILRSAWEADDGQDIAEYAVMLAVILVIVVGTIRLIGSNANNVFSSVASSIK
jgi:Flp pilus assembly pilin Flp